MVFVVLVLYELVDPWHDWSMSPPSMPSSSSSSKKLFFRVDDFFGAERKVWPRGGICQFKLSRVPTRRGEKCCQKLITNFSRIIGKSPSKCHDQREEGRGGLSEWGDPCGLAPLPRKEGRRRRGGEETEPQPCWHLKRPPRGRNERESGKSFALPPTPIKTPWKRGENECRYEFRDRGGGNKKKEIIVISNAHKLI